MSNFWSFYIVALVVLNIGGCVWLLMWTRQMDLSDMPADGTTGHEYDGIREYNNPLPRWWLIMFWLSILFSVIYLALYPGLGKYQGLLGWTSHKEHDRNEQAYQEQYSSIYKAYAQQPVEALAHDAKAMKIAANLFANNCAVCHGTNARGGQGFPNLTDHDWLYGGAPEQIKETILNGRNAAMPAWKDTLGDDGVRNVVSYVRTLSGLQPADAHSAEGEKTFSTTCIACHGADGKGNILMGAPNLTDDIWLYGGSEARVTQTVANGRNGMMPAQKAHLGEERVHLLTAYVWSLSNTGK